MDMQQWKLDIEAHLALLRGELAKLAICVQRDAQLYAFYQCGEELPVTDKTVRSLVIGMLQELEYRPDRTTPPKRFAAVAASAATLEQVAEVNAVKAAFKTLHEKIRATVKARGSDAEASELMRRALSLAGEPRLSLDACDRKIPYLHDTVQRLRWYHTKGAASVRKTLADAIEALQMLKEQVAEDRLPLIEEEIGVLNTLDPCTPVAYRARRAVEATWFRARVLDPKAEKGYVLQADYGVNPIFFADTPRIIPDVGTPQPRRKSGAGRPPLISDNTVSFSLPHWFWYLKPETRAPKPAGKPRNPYAPTP